MKYLFSKNDLLKRLVLNLILLLLFHFQTSAQGYYFESFFQQEGFSYYFTAEGDALVPDGHGNLYSFFNSRNAWGERGWQIMKIDSNGNELWSKTCMGTDEYYIHSLHLDNMGNLCIQGTYQEIADFDPGPSVYNLPNGYNSYIPFYLKLDANGNFMWAKALWESSALGYNNISEFDQNDNLYSIGVFVDTVDFDPGPGIMNLSSTDHRYAMQKVDKDGNLAWAKKLPGIAAAPNHTILYYPVIKTDHQSNCYITGIFKDSIDFDFDSTSTHYVYDSTWQFFLLKIDSNGTFQWVKHCKASMWPNDITFDENNNCYITGYFTDTVDVDPGPNVNNIISKNATDIFLMKFNANGNFEWAKTAGGDGYDYATALFYNNGKIYVTGQFNDTLDIALGTHIQTASHPYGFYFQTLDTNGTFLNANVMNAYATPLVIHVSNSESVYIAGLYGYGDFDPSESVAYFSDGLGGEDYFLLKLSQDSCKNFTLDIDNLYNLNCIDTGIIRVTPSYSLGPHSYSWNTGETDSLINCALGGVYTVTVTDSRGCSDSSTFYLSGSQDSLSSNIDLAPYLVIAGGNISPGLRSWLTLNGINHSCQPSNGYIYIITDSLSSILNDSIADAISGDTLFFNFTNLYFDTPFSVDLLLACSTNATIGDFIHLKTGIVADSVEIYTANNTKNYSIQVLNSYDPNIKEGYPLGVCDSNFINKADPITYTIQFQNTGTGVAYDVVLIDSLPEGLDLYSLEIISSSHNYTISPITNNTIIFNFNNIYLPDSTSNEKESHGYITFELRPHQNTSYNVRTENKAYIYFDYNPPIITNSILRTFVDSIPVLDATVVFSNNTFTANQNNSNYQWVDCDNNFSPIPGEIFQTFTPSQNGNYALVVEKDGCSEMSSCFNFTLSSTLNVFEDPFLSIYPNPTENIIYIERQDNEHIQITLTDQLGRVFKQVESEDQLARLEIGDLLKGIYFMQIRKGNNITVHKIAKQ